MSVSVSDYEAVVQVIENYYVEGGRTGDESFLEHAFHPDAIMFGYQPDGSRAEGSWKQLIEYSKEFGGSPTIKTRTDVVAITPETAVVKLEMENSPDGSTYTDFHTLMKFDGEWKIIAKNRCYLNQLSQLLVMHLALATTNKSDSGFTKVRTGAAHTVDQQTKCFLSRNIGYIGLDM
ncbi:hypothetical protein NCS52_01217100 [Fusarium sp. LHS14.1]|nr:hypothetical protein NCS52_01217100 [Fusarium sp. LHS14.1]